MKAGLRRIFAPLVAALLLAACAGGPPVLDHRPPGIAGQAPEAASGFTEKTGWSARRQMVAAANPLAADAGHQMLKAGGSAVDAAIAVQMVLNLVEPQSSGIGGGLFLVHHDCRAVHTYDGRETAPSAATPALFMKDGRPMAFMQGVVGGRSVGVPGVLRALELAHRQHGRLPWKQLFQPAIRLAEQGFAISPRLAAMLRDEGAGPLRNDPEALAYFFGVDGQPKPAGTMLRNLDLAVVLREVAERGSAAFHEGLVARDIVAKVRAHPTNPGLLTEADMAGYQAKRREPLCFDYKAWRLCGMPPPSSGPLAIGQMLGMLSHRDLASAGPVPSGFGLEPSAEAVHLISEAGRLAYADRGLYVADPDFVPLPGGNASAMLDPRYLQQRAALITPRSMGRASPGVPPAAAVRLASDRSPERPGTSHISVVDAHGNALSMTTTIENAFGAQIMVRGFLLNNQLTDFSFVPSEGGVPVANRVEGGKRPRSSMAPMLVFDRASGELVMTVGSPGGSAIINYVAKVLVGTLDWGLNVQQAISLPNFGSRNGPTELEQGRSSPLLIDALKTRGHEVRVNPQTSGLQGIQRIVENGRPMWFGGADPRREGVVVGD
ncbi:gamma-glutamyltransferase [Piscinibacter sp.]|uniref:gamma-glutamyltransferase n=1 Tax=Piscinibacter sp. TaxID=1903157 RepID=UPI002C36BDFC|nr:gamma-glutamyltransferase [Albitalea sp.]HUG23914.1 gamma-glutamyltransferase [Albitalea sp.]